MRHQYEDNLQMQSNCAKFIHQFIGRDIYLIYRYLYLKYRFLLERIRNRIRSLQSSNEEEVILQLNGLEQV